MGCRVDLIEHVTLLDIGAFDEIPRLDDTRHLRPDFPGIDGDRSSREFRRDHVDLGPPSPRSAWIPARRLRKGTDFSLVSMVRHSGVRRREG